MPNKKKELDSKKKINIKKAFFYRQKYFIFHRTRKTIPKKNVFASICVCKGGRRGGGVTLQQGHTHIRHSQGGCVCCCCGSLLSARLILPNCVPKKNQTSANGAGGADKKEERSQNAEPHKCMRGTHKGMGLPDPGFLEQQHRGTS
jgi:hypothetical protein